MRILKGQVVSTVILAVLLLSMLFTLETGIAPASPDLVNIYLESRELDGSTSNLGTIQFEPEPYPGYSLPTTIQRETAPYYTATYYPPSGHVIDHWELSGGIQLVPPHNLPTSPLISVEVTSSGTLRAIYKEPTSPPSAPLDLTATSWENRIQLSWQEPADQGSSEIVEYKVYRGSSLGSETYHDSIYAPFTFLSYDDPITDDNLYYYYVTAVNNDELESPPSNHVKSSRMESLKGIQSVVHLNEVHTMGYKEFSIQQNFWIKGDNQRIWAQNVVVVNPSTNTMYGVFDLWSTWLGHTIHLWPWPRINRSPDFDFTNHLTFYSVIDGDTLTMKNEFASLDYSLAPNSFIECWPVPSAQIEIVFVGSMSWGFDCGSASTVEFLPVTEGYIDNYVLIGTSSWLHGLNTVLDDGTETWTCENSSGLQFDWPLPGDFQSTPGWTDQGYRLEPDYSRELVSPPELPTVPHYSPRVVVDAHCPVNLHLFDDLGRHLGFNASSGLFDYGIPNSTMQVSADAQYGIVFNPEGYYRIWVEGIDEGHYTLTEYVANSTSSVSIIGNYTGTITNGTSVSYGVSVKNGTGISGIPGDINLDGEVDIADLSFMAARFGTDGSNPLWNATADTFPDGQIDIRDLYSVAIQYGKVSEVFTWRDDLDYETVGEMVSAGWTVGGESMMDVGGGVVTLDNDGSVGSSVYYDDKFPSSIVSFVVETEGMWIGRSFGTLQVVVKTERHGYIWMLDGYYHEYAFIRDGVKVLRFGGYTPQKDVWMTIGLKKEGNTFYLYHNGELKNTYTELDETPDPLFGVGISSGWKSTAKYAYISVCEQFPSG